VEYKAHPHKIKIYRRNDQNVAEMVATIERHTGKGWRFHKTMAWNEHRLPHFGQLKNIRTHYNGKKTISSQLEHVLDEWGIRHDGIKELNED